MMNIEFMSFSQPFYKILIQLINNTLINYLLLNTENYKVIINAAIQCKYQLKQRVLGLKWEIN